MSKSFADEIRDAVAAKKQTSADSARAQQELMKKRREERQAHLENAVPLMEDAWNAAIEGLKATGVSATLNPLHVSYDGEAQQSGHVLTVSHPGTPKPDIVTVDCNGFITIQSRKGESHEGRGVSITTPQEAQQLVRQILAELDLL